MAVGIAKIKCANATGVRVPVRQPLRSWRSMLHLVFPEPLVCLIHVADDNGDVLKPAVIAARIDRGGTSFRGQILGQLDEFVAELQARAAEPQSEKTLQVL